MLERPRELCDGHLRLSGVTGRGRLVSAVVMPRMPVPVGAWPSVGLQDCPIKGISGVLEHGAELCAL